MPLLNKLKSVAKPVYYEIYRGTVKTMCWYEDLFRAHISSGFRLPPAMLRFRVSGSISAREFLRIGERCVDLVEVGLVDSLAGAGGERRVLDFGCGCGRTIAWLSPRHSNVAFYGTDVDTEAVEWCVGNLPNARFITNLPLPPLPFCEHFFDAVYCFSVFTHLNETMQDQWLLELKRVLKPGGQLLITVHGANAANALMRQERERLLHEGFVHLRSRKLKGIVPDWYHTSWHTKAYITHRLKDLFRDIEYREVSDGMQDIVLARA